MVTDAQKKNLVANSPQFASPGFFGFNQQPKGLSLLELLHLLDHIVDQDLKKNKMKPTNPNADTYVEEQRHYLFITYSSEPICGAPWRDTLKWHSCRTPFLLDTLVRHFLLDTSSGTLLLDPLLGHSYLTLLTWHSCKTLLTWHSCKTLLLDTSYSTLL